MHSLEQKFLNDLDDKLWKAADKLRSSLDAANYKHIVLGLIFLKYVSDAFDERQSELKELFAQKTITISTTWHVITMIAMKNTNRLLLTN